MMNKKGFSKHKQLIGCTVSWYDRYARRGERELHEGTVTSVGPSYIRAGGIRFYRDTFVSPDNNYSLFLGRKDELVLYLDLLGTCKQEICRVSTLLYREELDIAGLERLAEVLGTFSEKGGER